MFNTKQISELYDKCRNLDRYQSSLLGRIERLEEKQYDQLRTITKLENTIDILLDHLNLEQIYQPPKTILKSKSSTQTSS